MSTTSSVGSRSVTQPQVQQTPPEPPAAPEPSAPSAPEPAATPESYFQDGFQPAQAQQAQPAQAQQAQPAQEAANNGLPLPPQGTEVSASHDIQTSPVSGVRVESSARVTNTKVEPGLNNTVTIEASASIGNYVGGEAGREGQVTVGGTALAGQKFTYETKVSPQQADAIRNGTAQLPNPFDPLNMPEGSAEVLKGQNYVSTEFEAAYRHIAAESKVTDLRGAGMGVERLDGNRVRISAGPVNAIENEAFFGVGGENWAVGLKNKQGLENTSMRVAELDLSTQEGMDKYQRFLMTGQVPEADGNTVTRSGTTETLKYTNETSVRANLGPIDINATLASSEAERKVTNYTDGSRSEEFSMTYGQGVNLTINKDFDFRGSPVANPDKPTYALTMGRVDPASSSYLASAFAQDPDSAEARGYHDGPAQDAQISFTPEQAQEMQRLATAYVQKYNPGSSIEDASVLGTSGFMRQVAMARNADEVAAVFARATSSGSIAEHLLSLRAEPENIGRPLPGTLRLQNAP
jgi:hypothetical protein